MPLLEIRDLHVHYGVIKAVRGVDLTVEQGDVVTLIGANGAGKSTTMNAIMNLVPAASGSIRFGGTDITGLPSHAIVRHGISIAPEGRQVFPHMSVAENLKMGAYATRDAAVIAAGFEQAYTLFPILKERAHQMAGTLSGGEQQMLAVARAIMSSPRLLIMDEPSLGLAPLVVRNIFELVGRIRSLGITVLLVEQNARMALSHAHRGYVMETGRIALHDTSENLLANPKVAQAYLGG